MAGQSSCEAFPATGRIALTRVRGLAVGLASRLPAGDEPACPSSAGSQSKAKLRLLRCMGNVDFQL